jgi:hypothetical protein
MITGPMLHDEVPERWRPVTERLSVAARAFQPDFSAKADAGGRVVLLMALMNWKLG